MTRMADTELLEALRNCHVSEEVALAAAERLEGYMHAYERLREYAEKQGIDTAAHPCGKPPADVKQEIFRRINGLATFVYDYWTAQDVGPERTWGANLYEIIRTSPREARE